MARLILFAPFLAITIGAVYFLFFKSPPPLPELDLDEWWGPKQLKTKQDTSIRPFKVKFDEGMIIDLKQRLKNHRKWTPPLEGVAFEYGFNTNQLDSWVSYWAEKYDFKAREAALNKYPQFKANIQGLDIHFIRVTPEAPGKEVVPMLLLHGWPGSVREFHESIPLLTAVRSDRDFALEVIVPSLPGYGFSDASVKPGLGPAELAVVFRNLMQRLGFEKYYIQGGDAGSVIGSNMATLFPKEVLGFHTNMAMVMSPLATVTEVLGSFFPSLIVEKELQHRLYPMSTVWAHLLEESGYVHLQSTKPDTAGVALADSPVGLLAYILEKFSTWTNKGFKYHPDGGLSKKFTKDQLIDNLMYYWSTNSVTTSFRLYAESFCKKQMGYRMAEIPTPVPTWAIQAGHELTYQPPLILKYKFTNLLNTTVFSDGGHFFAFEMPKEFSDNVLSAVDEFRKFAKAKAKTEASVKPGLGPAELAVVFRNFMQRLGFEKYYIQGGDAGSVIGSNMATLFPKEVLGFHTNMAMVMSPLATVTEVLGSFFPSLIVEKELQHRLYPMSTVWAHLLEESGYVHLQSTKPDTAGVALADSPVGLLAYILEKFSTWTNKGFKYHPDGGLSKKFTKDQLIDNLMYYWSTNSVTTSFRLYAESFCKKQMGYRMAEIPTPVPTWAIQAGHELTYQPPLILKYKFTNLLNTTVFSDGGHFFAFEMPKEFSDNVLSAVDEFRKFAKAKAKTEL